MAAVGQPAKARNGTITALSSMHTIGHAPTGLRQDAPGIEGCAVMGPETWPNERHERKSTVKMVSFAPDNLCSWARQHPNRARESELHSNMYCMQPW